MAGQEALFSLPHDDEAERGLLGSLIDNAGAYFDEVLEVISADDFYNTANRSVFNLIKNLKESNTPIDLIHLREEMERVGVTEEVGGISYISSLTMSYSVSTRSVDYAKIIKEKSVRRQGYVISRKISDDVIDPSKDVITSLDSAASQITDILLGANKESDRSIGEYVDRLFNKILKVVHGEAEEDNRLSTGFTDLDHKCSGGFAPGDYVIIAARPSIGKTAFAVSMALNMVKKGHKVAFFSLEMPAEAIAKRVLSIESKIDASRITRMSIPDEQMDTLFDAAQSLFTIGKNFIIKDTPNMALMNIRAKARQLKKNFGIECIIIDYIGIISMQGEVNIKSDAPRFEQIGYVSKSLKQLARELEIPVVVLCQVNRDSEDKEPVLSNLRDSGAIEQDADVVCFLHRKREGYSSKGSGEDLPVGDGNIKVAPTKLIIAKNRDGEIGACDIGFHFKTTAFVNMAPSMYQNDD